MNRSLRQRLLEAEPLGIFLLSLGEQFRSWRAHLEMETIRSRPQRMSVTGRMCACCIPWGMTVLLAAALLATGTESVGTAAYAESGKEWAGEIPVITTARAAHSLSNEEAQRSLPVHLLGVVTYFDPDYGTGRPAIFIHDATGGIFVELHCKATCKPADQIFAGALLDVHGVSAPGGFGPIVDNSQVSRSRSCASSSASAARRLCHSENGRGRCAMGGSGGDHPSGYRIPRQRDADP